MSNVIRGLGALTVYLYNTARRVEVNSTRIELGYCQRQPEVLVLDYVKIRDSSRSNPEVQVCLDFLGGV